MSNIENKDKIKPDNISENINNDNIPNTNSLNTNENSDYINKSNSEVHKTSKLQLSVIRTYLNNSKIYYAVILILIITLITTLIFLIIFYNEKEYYKKVAISNTEIYWNIYNRSLLGESSSKDYLIQYDSLGTISISTKTNELEDCSSYYYLYESCETLNKITMSSRTASALDKIKLVISRLGLPNTLSVSLSNTNAIQGRIKDNYFSINGGEVSVEYTYSPKNGIFILFSHICELQCLKSSEGKTV